MAAYRIVCTEQEPAFQPHDRAHIVVVGTGGDSGWDRRWAVSEVLQSMALGNVFYTVSPSTGAVAVVQSYSCSICKRTTLRSAPDAIADNNLDNLNRCALART